MALTTWAAYQAAHPEKAQQLTQTLVCVKGSGVDENYVLEADPATGSLPVSATLAAAPILFTLNGADQEVTEDTVIPANNRPLPVKFVAPQEIKITDGTDTLAVNADGSVNTKPVAVTMANPPVRNVYTVTPVTTATYVELVASLTATAQKIHIFDSSGQTLIFAVGAAGAENPIFYIPPGGIDISVNILATSRIAIKALSANCTVGEIVMNITT